MKAVLVIDMPKCCSECPCFYLYNCVPIKKELGIATSQMGIPIDFCPLKPIPQKHKEVVRTTYDGTITNQTELQFAAGYNACIQEILEREE